MIITRLWREQPGTHFCISTKSISKKWKDTFFRKSEFKDVPDFLEENRDKNIYFCPHGFSKPQRLKDFAVPPKMLWCDLDEADPRTVKLRPSIAFESSPGRFVGLWLLDKEIDEELNRELSYHLGADKSGWDYTQVLRVPGTTNYKYAATPKVKIMWVDGPTYTRAEIEKKLPNYKKGKMNGHASLDVSSDAAGIYRKYEKKLPSWIRRELIGGKPTPGKRSEMIWKMQNTLLEKGVNTDEAFVLIKSSPWNKFSGRRNEDEQLHRELDKVINGHMRVSMPSDDDEEKPDRLLARSMDEVEEENIDWLYYPYLALGELTILEGDPGLGKSYLAQIIAKHICDGVKLPSVKPKRVQGKVLYFDIENSAGTVTKKRLTANGLQTLENFYQCEEPFSIDSDDDLDLAYDLIEEIRPKLVVFDTLNTYLGKADAFKGHEAQQSFVKFVEIARRFHCAVLTLRHLTKSTRERALYRGQGSISFTGLARVVMTVGCLPDEPDVRAMAVTKINVAKPPQALSFTIESIPDTLKEQDRSRFVWGEFLDMTSEDLLTPMDKEKKATADEERAKAKEFLEQVLDDGALEQRKLEKMAEARSITHKALLRAAEELSIQRKTTGFGKDKVTRWSFVAD